MNARGIRTARGGRWHVSNVKNAIDRQGIGAAGRRAGLQSTKTSRQPG